MFFYVLKQPIFAKGSHTTFSNIEAFHTFVFIFYFLSLHTLLDLTGPYVIVLVSSTQERST
jgi:hypothetical protein